MYILRRQWNWNILNTAIRFYSLARKTHYEVLKLRRNCSDKEIKEAFIQMSKAYHPDKNKDVAAQEKFVRIVEAYNVLSKPGSRAQYDSMTDTQGTTYVYKTHVPYNIRRNQYNYQYQSRTQKTQNTAKNNVHEGVSGIKKVPNYIIIMMCCGFALLGCVVQLFIIREMYVSQRHHANEKSKYLAEELSKVRSAAQANSNEIQTQILLEKIVSASNPTVATASLGQALASEKKDTESSLTEFGISDMVMEDFHCSSYRNSMEGNRAAYTFQSWCLH